MKHLIILIITVCFSSAGFSQINEIGVFAGGSNFIGDIGSTKYISPNKPAFGAIYKWNRSPRHSYRFSLIYSDLEGNDLKSNDPRRIERGYHFINGILELSVGLEFTFLDFNLHDGDNKSTPYLFTGVTASYYDNYFYRNGNRRSENTSSIAYGIPMAVGFKTTLSEKFILAAEIGARYMLSDELDGSMPDSDSLIERFSFGNTNNNDWYVFTGITLTYTFGRKPCYCDY